MPKRLLALSIVFLVVAVLALGAIARHLLVPRPLPGPGRVPAPAVTAQAPAPPPAAPASAYSVVASRNLFSPTRTESASGVGLMTPVVGKPNLYGVVLRDGQPSIAYLEDPSTKRVAGYRIGDAVGGGTLRAITKDSVTIERPEGKIDVALRDPSKPRPAAAALPGGGPVPAAIPGGAVLPGGPVLPGGAVIPGVPRLPATPGGVQGTPPVTSEGAPPAGSLPSVQGRRLPFDFLRRQPQVPATGQPPASSPPVVSPSPPAPGAPSQRQQD